MKVLLTGATGFIGLEVIKVLKEKGHDVVILSRNKERALSKMSYPVAVYEWDPEQELVSEKALEGIDAVIHLAGESVASRWTKSQKEKIKTSRELGTRHLMQSLLKMQNKPRVVVSASAIGYYGDRAEEELTEKSKPGTGFLPEVCEIWEEEIHKHKNEFERLVSMRIGIVLEKDGGALKQMLTPFKLGVGGPIGMGKQWMSWIHRDDVVGLLVWALENQNVAGIVNTVAPNPVRNKEFTKVLAKTLNRPALFPAPPLALKIVLGEMSELVLVSQNVKPEKALSLGYQFKFTHLQEALEDILLSEKKTLKTFVVEQWVDKPVDELFPFFAEAHNLETITPPWLNFRVVRQSHKPIMKDAKIDYKLKVHGIPMRWRSLIEDWHENHMFVDTQVKGPYKHWHHTHQFEARENGTVIRDEVKYQVPLGKLGDALLGDFIRKDVEEIFDYRRLQIQKRFG